MHAKPLTWSLPAKTYCDPETHKRERAKIFTANWSLFTWASRIELPGTYVTGTLAGYPIVVLRDRSGVLRGFHNVCRHRGAMLLQGEGVCGHVITCPYHAWAYHDDGRLLKATEFGDAPDFDAQEWALRAVDVEAWRGLIFVRITRGGPGLVNWLGPIVDMAAGYDLESQRFFMKKEREVAIDWKAYAENYLECYHCRMMHPGLCDSLDINRYTVDVHREDWFFHLHAPKREGGLTRGLYFYRFPYLMLNLYDWGSSIATVEPLGPGRVRHINWYLFKDISPERAEDNRASAEWSAQIVTEDLAMVEGVQRNLEAGIYERGPLSPRWEHGVAAFHDMVREVLDPPPAVKSVAA